MAIHSVNHFDTLLNQQINLHLSLHDNLAKVESLTSAATLLDFPLLPAEIIHDYMWVLSDLVASAKSQCDLLLDMNFKSQPRH
jgi:hypothetical protein